MRKRPFPPGMQPWAVFSALPAARFPVPGSLRAASHAKGSSVPRRISFHANHFKNWLFPSVYAWEVPRMAAELCPGGRRTTPPGRAGNLPCVNAKKQHNFFTGLHEKKSGGARRPLLRGRQHGSRERENGRREGRKTLPRATCRAGTAVFSLPFLIKVRFMGHCL